MTEINPYGPGNPYPLSQMRTELVSHTYVYDVT